MEKPLLIYKYENAGEYSLLNLKNSTIYFNSPTNFNDPYDCSFGFNIEDISDEEIEIFRSTIIHQGIIQTDGKEQFLNATLQEIRNSIIKSAKTAIETQMNIILKTNGIACFTEVNDNLLMWSHYAKSSKGFCLEFDTSFKPFHQLKKVKYMPNLPTFDAIKIQNYDESLFEVSKLWLTKSIHWKYEEEWRIIGNTANTWFKYDPNALKSIYFGPLIEKAYREIICLVVQVQNPNVKFYQGKISPNQFKMEFEEFNYTSNIQKTKK